MTIARQLSEVAMAAVTGTVLLVRHLGEQGVIDKNAYAALLDQQADILHANPPTGRDPADARMDLKMLRHMAELIRSGPTTPGEEKPLARWTPTVLEGGKDD